MTSTHARLIQKRRVKLDDASFVELVIWRVPKPLAGSRHDFKYRLALVVNETCVLRYDNEAGKGDHRHVGGREELVHFVSMEQVLGDFWADVAQWRRRNDSPHVDD
ncbi:DUF6516 family protein [Thermomonas brevis]